MPNEFFASEALSGAVKDLFRLHVMDLQFFFALASNPASNRQRAASRYLRIPTRPRTAKTVAGNCRLALRSLLSYASYNTSELQRW